MKKWDDTSRRIVIAVVVVVVLFLAITVSYPLSWKDQCRKFCLVGHPFEIEADKVEKIELRWGSSYCLTLEAGTEDCDAVVDMLNQFEMSCWVPKAFTMDWGDEMWIYYDGQVYAYFYTQDHIGSGSGSMIGDRDSMRLLYKLMEVAESE